MLEVVLTTFMLAAAQLPVPTGEQAILTIHGRVTDLNGQGMRGVRITAANGQARISREALTDEQGAYSVTRLPAGRYELSAFKEGFTADKKEITISSGASASVDFKLGPVPNAERAAVSPRVDIVRATFDADLALQTWLNSQASKGLRLVSVIPIENKTSFFVFSRVTPETNTTMVMTVSGTLDADSLSARLIQYPGRTFIGVHRIGPSSYLLLIR